MTGESTVLRTFDGTWKMLGVTRPALSRSRCEPQLRGISVRLLFYAWRPSLNPIVRVYVILCCLRVLF